MYEGLDHKDPDLDIEAGQGKAPALDKSETLGTELRRRGLRITFQVPETPLPCHHASIIPSPGPLNTIYLHTWIS